MTTLYNIYYYLGFFAFWLIATAIVIAALMYIYISVRDWVDGQNWIHFYIQSHKVDTVLLREKYRLRWVVNKGSNRKYILLYRLRNIKIARKGMHELN